MSCDLASPLWSGLTMLTNYQCTFHLLVFDRNVIVCGEKLAISNILAYCHWNAMVSVVTIDDEQSMQNHNVILQIVVCFFIMLDVSSCVICINISCFDVPRLFI